MDCAPAVIGRKALSKRAPEKCSEFGSTDFDANASCGKAGSAKPIRIYTLGRFSLAIGGQPIGSDGKAKHRPLALLKTLIALGGRCVASSQVWECLWPDSEGDLGGRNLNITVHRLRHMLQANAAVLQHDGKLTLNEQICWVDAWHFERLVNDGLRRLGEPVTADASELTLRTALGSYAGDFLARESEESWMLAPRLRLKTKFDRVVCALSTHFEHQTRFADAIDICLQALEKDPLNELLYRRMMSCHLKQGEFAGALRAYACCREALAKGLSAPVSSETERLHLEALRATNASIAQTDKRAPLLMIHRDSPQKQSLA